MKVKDTQKIISLLEKILAELRNANYNPTNYNPVVPYPQKNGELPKWPTPMPKIWMQGKPENDAS